MRILVAFDKFKHALSAHAACAVAANAISARHPDWSLDLCPLTDGGEGFCETLTGAAAGRFETQPVTGPRLAPVNASIGYVQGSRIAAGIRDRLRLPSDAELALIGLSSASGLELLPVEWHDPWQTTTLGTGELIGSAVARNAGAILLGVGGSATNDLGFGALAALGFRFLDTAGAVIAIPTPATWENIQRIDTSGISRLPPIYIACDVTNPLLGPTGATATFGPQKGLKPADLPGLEAQGTRMAALLCQACNRPLSLAATPGAGAAGGIAFGLMVAADASLVAGFDLVSDWLDLPARVAAADLVLTGEGRFDATSLGGKGPGSLVREAQRLGKPTHLFAGSVALPDRVNPVWSGVTTCAITPAGMALAEALSRTAELLAAAVSRELS